MTARSAGSLSALLPGLRTRRMDSGRPVAEYFLLSETLTEIFKFALRPGRARFRVSSPAQLLLDPGQQQMLSPETPRTLLLSRSLLHLHRGLSFRFLDSRTQETTDQ